MRTCKNDQSNFRKRAHGDTAPSANGIESVFLIATGIDPDTNVGGESGELWLSVPVDE
jgi:hypothetical protein